VHGISSKVLPRVESWLTTTRGRVDLNGSVLKVLLFFLSVNYSDMAVQEVDIKKFADDTKICQENNNTTIEGGAL
jgi:hypothetical protein